MIAPAGCAIGLGDRAAMKKAASGGVFASTILVAHAECMFLALHEDRGKLFARGDHVLAFTP